MISDIVIASADVRHVAAAKSAAAGAGLVAELIVGAAFPRSTSAFLTKLGRSHLAIADYSYFRGPGLAKIGRRLPVVRGSALKDRWWRAAERGFDSHVAGLLQNEFGAPPRTGGVFHGFGGFAADSQVVASDLGYFVINDAFELHPQIERQFERQEMDFLEIEVPAISGARATLMARRAAALSSAHQIIAGLPSVAASLELGGVEQDRILVGHYGVPDWIRRTTTPTGDRSVATGPLKLLYVGQIHWFKGLQRLISAIQLLPKNSVELTICGATYPGPVAEKLLARIKELDRHCNVRFLGSVNHADLLDEYRRCDALFFPSIVGGVGLSVLEAASLQIPLFLSSGEGIFEDGISMRKIGVSVSSIASGLEWFNKNRAQALEMGKNAANALYSENATQVYGDVLADAYIHNTSA